MTVENMLKMSYLLFIISGVLAVSAVVLFLVLNIPKCLRMVSGKYPASKYSASEKQQTSGRIGRSKTEKLSSLEVFDGSEATLLLGSDGRSGYASAEETLLLSPETNNLDMIQDIVYMQENGSDYTGGRKD